LSSDFKPTDLQKIILEILIENHDAKKIMTQDELIAEAYKREERIKALKDQK